MWGLATSAAKAVMARRQARRAFILKGVGVGVGVGVGKGREGRRAR
jgi:hypothetical protein